MTTFQGKFAEAGPLYVQALKIEEDILGPEDPWLAWSLSSQAQFLMGQVSEKGISPKKTFFAF